MSQKLGGQRMRRRLGQSALVERHFQARIAHLRAQVLAVQD